MHRAETTALENMQRMFILGEFGAAKALQLSFYNET